MNHTVRMTRMFPTIAADAAAGDLIAKDTLGLLAEAYAQGRDDERLARILNQNTQHAIAVPTNGSDC